MEAPGPGGEEAVRQGVLTGFPVHACLYPKAGGAASHKRCGSRQGERRADQTGACNSFNINKDSLMHALFLDRFDAGFCWEGEIIWLMSHDRIPQIEVLAPNECAQVILNLKHF